MFNELRSHRTRFQRTPNEPNFWQNEILASDRTFAENYLIIFSQNSKIFGYILPKFRNNWLFSTILFWLCYIPLFWHDIQYPHCKKVRKGSLGIRRTSESLVNELRSNRTFKKLPRTSENLGSVRSSCNTNGKSMVTKPISSIKVVKGIYLANTNLELELNTRFVKSTTRI